MGGIDASTTLGTSPLAGEDGRGGGTKALHRLPKTIRAPARAEAPRSLQSKNLVLRQRRRLGPFGEHIVEQLGGVLILFQRDDGPLASGVNDRQIHPLS